MSDDVLNVELPRQAAGATRNPSIRLFAALAAINFFRIGYQLVVVAWSAVQSTGRADAAGKILLISTVASLVLSPIIGAMVDYFARKKTMLFFGHVGIVVAGAAPLVTQTMLSSLTTFEGIAVAVVIATVSSAVLGGAMDYFLKTHLPQSERPRHLAMLNSTAQIALIFGTAFGGLIVSQADSSHAFLVISLCGALLAGLSFCLLPALNVARDSVRSTWKRGAFSAGPMLYLRHRRLFAIATCAALAFSIGQITNALLPALIGVYFRGTSVNYSMIEAAWSIGALLVGLWLARFAANFPSSMQLDFIVVGAMAVVLAAIPLLSAFPALLTTHFSLGAGFALVRIRSETRFLTECPRHLLGRFRANSVLMTSGVGLLIFATPSVYGGASVAELYVAMAGVVAASAIGLLVVTRQSVRR
ncbi:MFS transporter [Trinickia sp. LjRoot230]|uniref:MFS transporter n=1 Tax=Trinickia sp. LjRoot230 TaxID=3342288 RepID=UPI003ECF1D40